MPSIFATFNSVRRAMGAQQYAVNVTSHNIANANTEGYSRQRVTMETTKPEGVTSLNSTSGPGQLGTGVDIREVSRTRDIFLDSQIRNELSTLGRFEARDEFLSEIETILMEPSENGLSTTMGKMWDAWQTLSKNPENSNTRTGVIEASLTFTNVLNHTYIQLESLEAHSDELIKGQVFDFNGLIGQIEDLNRQIKGVRITGSNPNDLMDKQDLLIDRLSSMINIKVTRGPLGEATITSGGTPITGLEKQSLSAVKVFEKKSDGSYDMVYYDKGNTNELKVKNMSSEEYSKLKDVKVIWTDGNGSTEKAQFENGSIKGYNSIFREIGEYKNQLDALARGLAFAVNTVHNDGRTPEEYINNDIALFVAGDKPDDESAITAKNITVNPRISADPSKIHANARYNDPNLENNDAIGNGDRALAISQIRNSRIFMNEFLDTKSSISSGVIISDENTDLNVSGKLTVKSNGISADMPIAPTDSLKEIVEKINSLDNGKTLDSEKLFIKASVDNGRLIIQNLKSEDNSIDISDDMNGDVLKGLKIYSKDDPDYWSNIRNDNTLISNYHPYSSNDAQSMRIIDDPKGTDINSYFKDTISKLGSSARQAKSMVTSQDALIGQLETRKESISGVSTDEEMANLVQYQHAYEAAAKAVSILDEMLDTIINGLIR